jgi:hypothetical protein
MYLRMLLVAKRPDIHVQVPSLGDAVQNMAGVELGSGTVEEAVNQSLVSAIRLACWFERFISCVIVCQYTRTVTN